MKKLLRSLTVLLLSSTLFAGCKTTNWAQECAERFPPRVHTVVKETVKFDTLTVQGEALTIRDTVPCPDGTKVPVQYTRPCPPVKVVTQTITKDSIVQVENTAQVNALLDKTGEQANEILLLQERARQRRKWLFILPFAGALLGFFAPGIIKRFV